MLENRTNQAADRAVKCARKSPGERTKPRDSRALPFSASMDSFLRFLSVNEGKGTVARQKPLKLGDAIATTMRCWTV